MGGFTDDGGTQTFVEKNGSWLQQKRVQSSVCKQSRKARRNDPAHGIAEGYIAWFAKPRYRLMINVIDK